MYDSVGSVGCYSYHQIYDIATIHVMLISYIQQSVKLTSHFAVHCCRYCSIVETDSFNKDVFSVDT